MSDFDDLFKPVDLDPLQPYDEFKESLASLESQVSDEAFVDLDGNGKLDSVIRRIDADQDGIFDSMQIIRDGITEVVPYDETVWNRGTTAWEAAGQSASTVNPASDAGELAGASIGAGTCSHCGGSGSTTWPSSGSKEQCWYCGGSGVAS